MGSKPHTLPEELKTRDEFFHSLFSGEAVIPFSFKYGGNEFPASQDGSIERTVESRKTEEGTGYSIRFRCSSTGLEVLCDVNVYDSFPVIDWTLYFRNTDRLDTPVISDIKTLDMKLPIESDGLHHPVLHHFVGSPCAENDFEPRETFLSWGIPVTLSTCGGRSSNSDMPYFNIETKNLGVVMAIGWPGQWSASFQRNFPLYEVTSPTVEHFIDIKAGQSKTHFKLLPGEMLRAPRMVMMLYHGSFVRSQNMWRQWMRTCNQPKAYGEQLKPQFSATYGNLSPGLRNSAKGDIELLGLYLKNGIQPDNLWQDAGWYPCSTTWSETGTWEWDPVRYPAGFREVSDYCHANGMKTIVWFEPERVYPGTWLYKNKPEWLMRIKDSETALLRIGDPECLAWVIERFNTLIQENGIDVYRQDFNMEVLPYWEADDAEDRQGVSEIKHITAYLALWDALLEANPGMFIDTCASGGRRLDIETLKRSVPLLRSDYTFFNEANQAHTYGLSFLVPFNGTGFMDFDEYSARSLMVPELTIGPDPRREDFDFGLLRRLVEEWRQISPLMLEGDYYPLTPYSLKDNAWMAWQFHCPHLDEGFVQVFRRPNCPHDAAKHKLYGLRDDLIYRIKNFDGGVLEMKGSELMKEGLCITADTAPKAITLYYRKVDIDTHSCRDTE